MHKIKITQQLESFTNIVEQSCDKIEVVADKIKEWINLTVLVHFEEKVKGCSRIFYGDKFCVGVELLDNGDIRVWVVNGTKSLEVTGIDATNAEKELNKLFFPPQKEKPKMIDIITIDSKMEVKRTMMDIHCFEELRKKELSKVFGLNSTLIIGNTINGVFHRLEVINL